MESAQLALCLYFHVHIIEFCVVCLFKRRRGHTIFDCDWSSDVCSSDLGSPVWSVAREGGSSSFHGRHHSAVDGIQACRPTFLRRGGEDTQSQSGRNPTAIEGGEDRPRTGIQGGANPREHRAGIQLLRGYPHSAYDANPLKEGFG